MQTQVDEKKRVPGRGQWKSGTQPKSSKVARGSKQRGKVEAKVMAQMRRDRVSQGRRSFELRLFVTRRRRLL
jgi:hypothetical protein